jgi:DNA-binding FadR family transcriptional regulator
LHASVTEEMGVRIVSGYYKPGERLDREISACGTLNVSRSVYREAVRTLAAKGLVRARTRSGTMVLDSDEWRLLDPEVLVWLTKSTMSDHMLRCLIELRRLVEPMAAALAARRRTARDLALMKEGLLDIELGIKASRPTRDFDYSFRDAIFRASGNPFIVALSGAVRTARVLDVKGAVSQLNSERVLVACRNLFEAVRRSRPTAAYRAAEVLLAASTTRAPVRPRKAERER